MAAGLASSPTSIAQSIFTVELEYDVTFRGLRADSNAIETE